MGGREYIPVRDDLVRSRMHGPTPFCFNHGTIGSIVVAGVGGDVGGGTWYPRVVIWLWIMW